MRSYVLLIAAIVFSPHTSAAQDTPRFGIVMGYPVQIGILARVTDRVSVRPEITWAQSSFETTGTTVLVMFGPGTVPTEVTSTRVSTNDSWQVGVGLSGLLYLSKGDALRTYVSPRFSYARVSTTNDFGAIEFVPGPALRRTTVTSTYGVAGSLGAEYALAKRFGVFGELGLNYSRTGPSSTSPALPGIATKSSGYGVRSGVGVILFFGK